MKTFEREAVIRRLKFAIADAEDAIQAFEKDNEWEDRQGRIFAAGAESWLSAAKNAANGKSNVDDVNDFYAGWRQTV